jgi:signal transduction histidine kinase
LIGEGEAALQDAYQLGRLALVEGLGVLDIAMMHHKALEQILSLLPRGRNESRRLKAAAQFLAESLSVYEMAYRGFQERNMALRHINQVLEQEAARIAHLLHDEAGQALFAAQLSLTELERKADPSLGGDVRGIADVINQVGEQLRSLSHELRPTILDDLGLVPALEFLAQGVKKRAGIAVRVSSSIQGRLPSSMEVALFRAVQEGLTNVARHSNATQAEVALEQKGQTIFCTVSDTGVGFDVDKRSVGALGLIGIRERLNSVGGTLEIRSQPNQGTQLLIAIPFEV